MEVSPPKEMEPLLVEKQFSFYPMKPSGEHKNIYEDSDDDEIDENFEDEILVTEIRKKRSVGLIWQDLFLLTLDFLQIFALMQSMAVRWTWSFYWFRNAYFFFLFNFDIWEFIKLQNDDYLVIQNYDTPSATVNFEYWYVCLMWFVFVVTLGALYLVIYIVLKKKAATKLAEKLAWLKRVYFYLMQIFCLPIGTAVFRLFHCNKHDKMDVMNSTMCFNGIHWLYLAFGLIFVVLLFVVFPVYIIVRTRRESVGSCTKHHESFLLLKETEYKVGLNKVWLTCHFYLFSSYRFWGMYHRAIMIWIKLSLLIVFAAGFKSISGQAWGTFALLVVYFVAFLVIRPYRLTSFNVLLFLTLLALASLALLGGIQTQFNTLTLDIPWFLPQYNRWLLMVIVGLWFLYLLCFVIYLLIRKCRYRCNVKHGAVWPTFTSSIDDWLSPQAHKFLKTFLRARFVLEQTKIGPAIFAPVHDLARQIRIMNAYCREAEFLGDALHGIMWDLLDEMIEVHSDLNQKSLFAESVKQSIHQTARDFLVLMPAFSQRLAQRDYDFILVNPVKKRMLLKMYIMGVFLNGRSENKAKVQLLTKPALEKIWREPTSYVQDIEEEGYYEDLYPDPIEIQSDTSLDLSMESSEDDRDEVSFSRMYSQLPQTVTIDPNNFLRPESAASSQLTRGVTPPLSGPKTESRPNSASSGPRPQSRPNSATRTVLSRPNSASVSPVHISRPTSAASQTRSTGSRPGSGQLGSRPGSGQVTPRPGSGQSGTHPVLATGSHQDSEVEKFDEGLTNPGYIPEEPADQGSRSSVDVVAAAESVIDMEPTPTPTKVKKKKLTKRASKKTLKRESNA